MTRCNRSASSHDASAPDSRGEIPAQVRIARRRYERQKLGLFVHYVPGLTVDTHGKTPSIDELGTDLDAAQFARDAADFGVEYVIFTVMHYKARMLYPSEVNRRWRDDRRRNEDGCKTYADTDLIGRLAAELGKRDLDLHLYVHPVDGHDFSREDQDLTGWNDCSHDHAVWNDYQNELFDELCGRYAGRIAGLWFDGMFMHTRKEPRHECIQQDRLRETILSHDHALVLVGNLNGVRDHDPCPEWTAVDYRSWEVASVTEEGLGFAAVNPDVRADDATTWPGTRQQVAMIVGSNWWAADKTAEARHSPETLFRYLVLLASVSRAGGLAISAGCFPGAAADNNNGTIWEGNFRRTMIELNRLIAPVAESIRNTSAGTAYVTEDHQWLAQKDWGVSTESPDGQTVYLHILKPPPGPTLTLGPTADGSELGKPAELLRTKEAVELEATGAGCRITLAEGTSWDPLDTVISLRRARSS